MEIHANTLRTLLTGDSCRPVPEWVRVIALLLAAGADGCGGHVVRAVADCPSGLSWSLFGCPDLSPICSFAPAGCFPPPK